jgi:hypothetical protein
MFRDGRHSEARGQVVKCGRTSDGWSALAWMEKIVRKTAGTRKTTDTRELTINELDGVTGGLVVIAPAVSRLICADLLGSAAGFVGLQIGSAAGAGVGH